MAAFSAVPGVQPSPGEGDGDNGNAGDCAGVAGVNDVPDDGGGAGETVGPLVV
ncbi:MAG: hypothetical protein U1F67_09365 [Rubrivivax sp.]